MYSVQLLLWSRTALHGTRWLHCPKCIVCVREVHLHDSSHLITSAPFGAWCWVHCVGFADPRYLTHLSHGAASMPAEIASFPRMLYSFFTFEHLRGKRFFPVPATQCQWFPRGWFWCPAGAGAWSQPFSGDSSTAGSVPALFLLRYRSVPTEHSGAWELPCQERPCLGLQTCAASPRPGAHRHLTNRREPQGQQESVLWLSEPHTPLFPFLQSKNQPHRRGEYNVYSTFQSHEPEFDYLKSLEIEEKINKIRWLPQQNAAYFLLSTNGTWPWAAGQAPSHRLHPRAPTAGQGLLCSVALGKMYVKKMSSLFRVTGVSWASRNLARTVWRSSVPVQQVLSLFTASIPCKGGNLFPLLTTYIFIFWILGTLFFFF